MILLTLILFVSIVILTLLFNKNNIFYPILTKVIGVLIILLSLIGYTTKMSPYVNMSPFEHMLYMWFSDLRLSFRMLTLLENIGFSIFMLSTIIYCVAFKCINKFMLVLLCIPLFIRFYISTLSFGEHLYLLCYTTNNTLFTEIFFRKIIIFIQMTILLFYITLPYLLIMMNTRRTQLLIAKRNNIVATLMLLTVDLTSYLLLFASDLKYFTFINHDIMKYPVYIPFSINNNFFISMTYILALFFFIICAFKYTPLKKYNPNYINIEIDSLNENMIMLLHTYKNAFCAISQYSDTNISFINDDKFRLQSIKKISDKQFQEISNIINISRGNINQNTIPQPVNIITCIENALSNIPPNDMLKIVKNYYEYDLFVLGNNSQITEVLNCLFQNSIESMFPNSSNPTLTVTVGTEKNKIYINVTDNGKGINPKYIHKVFLPLFSSKMGGSNFGMGLTYAKRIIESHGGSIALNSKYKKATTFQIVLPTVDKFIK